jgi:membrane fusion protein (multidrug efflux system)
MSLAQKEAVLGGRTEATHGEGEVFDPSPHRPTRRMLAASLAVGGAVLASLLVCGIVPRVLQRRALAESERPEMPSVMVARAVQENANVGFELPGSMQALQETTIYARANGFVRNWRADIGARVKKGDVLAVLDIPDVDQELLQARATAAQSKAVIDQATAALAVAHANTRRYTTLRPSGVVSEQDADQFEATFDVQRANVNASRAAYNSQQANVQRLEYLRSFGTLAAPFDGVITMRTAEVGQLVVAGAAGQPLFRVAEVDILRVFINVPQLHAKAVRVGMHAHIRVREIRDRVFDGTVARTSEEIDDASRSLLTEVDIPNPDGTLLAGMYARVHLEVEETDRPVLVPATAVLFNARGTRAAVVQDGVVHWKSVVIERDLGDRLAIGSGLADQDLVAVMASEQLVDGMRVRPEEGKAGAPATNPNPKVQERGR